MSGSPKKKKPKFSSVSSPPSIDLKRGIQDSLATSTKKFKPESMEDVEEKDMKAKKRKNFVIACEQVSYKSYFDYRMRLQLLYLPACVNGLCTHQDSKTKIHATPSYAEESFKIEIRSNLWCEALEVCQMCITSEQYLSANILKDIVEIMMNAHEDEFGGYTVKSLIDRCQQILSLNFNSHPPCLIKNIRKCYNEFLTSPMDKKEKTFSNRTEFECEKGLVKYCMNRLEYEVSTESKDEALVDKFENIPEEMKQSVKGLHWQKERLEIFELLERPERIKRLMSVLEVIIELLQFDLAIWNSRYKNHLGAHIMRSHKPLVAYILWSTNVLHTGAVNNNCRQILRLFVYFVHLEYPEKYIKIMTLWLNTIVQTFYICENNSNSDFPNTGKYCSAFANEFYKIISGMPPKSIIKILEHTRPTFMQYMIGTLYYKSLLSTEESDPIKNLVTFLEEFQWNKFRNSQSEIKISDKSYVRPKKKKKKLKYLSKICSTPSILGNNNDYYPKLFDIPKITTDVDQNIIVHTLYITIEAYLDAYGVQNVQETLDNLNEQLIDSNHMETDETVIENLGSFIVTETMIKKYRSMYQMLTEVMKLFYELKNNSLLPEMLKVFEKIGLLGA